MKFILIDGERLNLARILEYYPHASEPKLLVFNLGVGCGNRFKKFATKKERDAFTAKLDKQFLLA